NTITRTWTATDSAGGSSTCTQTITVNDTTAPVISALPGPTTIECPATPVFATPTAMDACQGAVTPTFVDSSSGTCPVVHVRTWTATDACGRSEEHTSELQSRFDLVCRLLLEKNKHQQSPSTEIKGS